ncbi:hypothetical protein ACROYT_G026143 [Oculina patagonica]
MLEIVTLLYTLQQDQIAQGDERREDGGTGEGRGAEQGERDDEPGGGDPERATNGRADEPHRGAPRTGDDGAEDDPDEPGQATTRRRQGDASDPRPRTKRERDTRVATPTEGDTGGRSRRQPGTARHGRHRRRTDEDKRGNTVARHRRPQPRSDAQQERTIPNHPGATAKTKSSAAQSARKHRLKNRN